MFTTLHELAKKATLMITIATEGDGQLRVNVTPMPFDTKAKANLPQPLSLLATPTEFDADFIAALSTWQAPKRSLLQQAQDAAGGAPAAAPTQPAPKSEAKGDGKNEKPARKARGGKGGEDEKKVDEVPAAAAAAGEAATAANQVMNSTALASGDEPLSDAADASSTGTDAAEASGPAAAHVTDEGAGVAPAPAAEGGAAPAPAPAAEEDAGQAAVDTLTLDLF
jgi:PRTRC genetic system protein E